MMAVKPYNISEEWPDPALRTALQPKPNLAQQFRKFDEENPQVFERLMEMALALLRQGHRQYSMRGLFEVLRWEYALKTVDMSGFKLNNSYTSFYARELMLAEPRLHGFFELRTLRWRRRVPGSDSHD